MKFKAWDKLEKKFRNDVLLQRNGAAEIQRTSKELQKIIKKHYEKLGDILGGDYAVIDFTDYYAIENVLILQYTGLKDITGKEICVGDILSFDFNTKLNIVSVIDSKASNKISEEDYNVPVYEVIWEEYRPSGRGIRQNLYLHGFRFEFTKILGNIYENPELLEV